jgi:hypothetical protein
VAAEREQLRDCEPSRDQRQAGAGPGEEGAFVGKREAGVWVLADVVKRVPTASLRPLLLLSVMQARRAGVALRCAVGHTGVG